jgi:hypothetical protein
MLADQCSTSAPNPTAAVAPDELAVATPARYSRAMARLFIVMLTAVLAACSLAGPGCPCGQSYDSDPNDPGAMFRVGADHDESAHCFCRCGTDTIERLPPSATCEAYEDTCQTRAGTIARYTCE